MEQLTIVGKNFNSKESPVEVVDAVPFGSFHVKVFVSASNRKQRLVIQVDSNCLINKRLNLKQVLKRLMKIL